MFHRQEIAVNKATGVPIPGVVVRLYDDAGGPIALYSDASGTPIVSVSGIANAAVSDDAGNYSYYVANGVYTERIYVGDSEAYSVPDLVCQGLVTTIQTPTFADASAIMTSSETQLVIVSGTSAVGDAGTGRQFAYDAAVDSAYVTANPTTSFVDVTGRGFKEVPGSSANVGIKRSEAGAATRTVADKLGEIISAEDFGAVVLAPASIGDTVAEAANAAINNVAIQAAFDAAAATKADVQFQAGTYCYSTEFTASQPIGVIGRGWAATIFQPLTTYSGWFAGFTEVNFVTVDGSGNYTDDTSALRLKDFSVRARGGRSATQTQHGVRFIGRCDRVIMDHVYFAYLVGTALHFGHMNGDTSTVAYARECMISNVEARWCGDNANTRPCVVFDNYGTLSSQDGCNLIVTNRLWVVFPYYTGLKVVNNNGGGATTRRLTFNNTLVHGAAAVEPVQVTSAPLVHLVGNVISCSFRELWFNTHYTGQYGVQIEDNTSGTPGAITFKGGGISGGAGHGFNFVKGFGYEVDFNLWAQTGTGVTIGASVTAPVTISGGTVSSAGAPSIVNNAGAGVVSGAASLSGNYPIRAEKFALSASNSAPTINYFAGLANSNVTANTGSLCVNTAQAGALTSTTLAVKIGGAGATPWTYVQEIVGGTTATRPGTPTANQRYADFDRQRDVCYIGGAWREPQVWAAVPASLTTTGKAGLTAADANYVYTCYADNTWVRQAIRGTATNGDAAATLASTSKKTQRWTAPLTADRAVTLNTTGMVDGERFRIVRAAAATGAFNLNVGTGPLKALAVGQWCEVEYDGTAWFLSGFGSL